MNVNQCENKDTWFIYYSICKSSLSYLKLNCFHHSISFSLNHISKINNYNSVSVIYSCKLLVKKSSKNRLTETVFTECKQNFIYVYVLVFIHEPFRSSVTSNWQIFHQHLSRYLQCWSPRNPISFPID